MSKLLRLLKPYFLLILTILFFVILSVIFICFYYTNISAILVFLISLLGIFQHRSNIYRIINKTENKIGAKK